MSTAQEDLKVRPYQVAPETFVIPQLIPAPPVGHFYLNSMIITGREPVIVDTGTPSLPAPGPACLSFVSGCP